MRKSVNNKMMSSSRFDPPVKRKKIVLTVENKLETIDLLRKGTSYTVITEEIRYWQIHYHRYEEQRSQAQIV